MRTYKDLKAAKQRARDYLTRDKPKAPIVHNGWGGTPMSERTRDRVSQARRNVPVTLPKFSWDET